MTERANKQIITVDCVDSVIERNMFHPRLK